MRVLSIKEQIDLMSKRWPQFKVSWPTKWFVSWEGVLCPLNKRYVIRVVYCLGANLGPVEISPKLPQVQVLSPVLEGRPEDPKEPIPHHYPNLGDPVHPILCLYDPRKGEWNPSDYIGETILPWVINWLACYEGWRATGEWTGGGNH